MLKATIEQDLKNAMLGKRPLEIDTLRLLLARIKNDQIAKQKDFSDDEIRTIISSEIKRRRDSIAAYTQGNRPELAQKENEQAAVLQKYLPAQLSADEVRAIITATISGQNFVATDFGRAMPLVMAKLKGKTDGALVSSILKELLK